MTRPLATGRNNLEHSQLSNLKPALSGVEGSQILDPTALKRLNIMLGKRAAELRPKFITNFFKDAVILQERAREAVEQHQLDELIRAAHTLKSNARNFGAACA